jgi:uncharacterized protein (UPF0261 family)
MEASCRGGIPQVVIPGAADFILYGPLESVPPKMFKRRYVTHNPIHTHIKTTHEEMVAVGRYIGQRLALSTGPAEVLIPNRGFSQLNVAGGPLFEPESDRGFLEGLTQELGRTGAKHVRVRVVEMHINDPAFAETAARSLHTLILESRKISGDMPRDG